MLAVELELLALCAAFALGELTGFSSVRFGPCWPVAGVFALAAAWFGGLFAWRGSRALSFFLIGLALAWSVCETRAEAIRAATEDSRGHPHAVEFEVDSPSSVRRGADGRWASFLSTLEGLPVKVIVPLARRQAAPQAGERWRCAGWLATSGGRDVVRRRVFWVRGRGTSAERVRAADPSSFPARVRRVRQDLSRRAGLGLAHDSVTAGLNRAILLGERSRIDSESKAAFVGAGTIHVFAISGLHVMVIAQVLLVMMLLVGMPYRWTGLLLVPVLWGYVILVGLPPSAVRAAAMASLYHLAPVFFRRPNMLVAWALTFLSVHALDPASLFDVGSLLSFSVMLGILLWVRRALFASRAANALGVAFAAWAVGVPIAACVFGRVTPGGILANLVLVPVAGAGVVTGFLGLLASFVSESLAAHVNNFAALVTRLMAGVSQVVSRLPGANFEVESWSPAGCLAWYGAFALLFWLAGVFAARRKSGPF